MSDTMRPQLGHFTSTRASYSLYRTGSRQASWQLLLGAWPDAVDERLDEYTLIEFELGGIVRVDPPQCGVGCPATERAAQLDLGELWVLRLHDPAISFH